MEESQVMQLLNNNPDIKDFTSHVKTAISTMCKLDLIYENGTSEERKQIISSIYPEKMSFDGKGFRTTRLNSIVQLIYKLDKGSSEIKNRTRSKKLHLSGKEVPSELFSNYFSKDLHLIAGITLKNSTPSA